MSLSYERIRREVSASTGPWGLIWPLLKWKRGACDWFGISWWVAWLTGLCGGGVGWNICEGALLLREQTGPGKRICDCVWNRILMPSWKGCWEI